MHHGYIIFALIQFIPFSRTVIPVIQLTFPYEVLCNELLHLN
ncbi:membrane protein [Staphylococcus aureus]|nr:membrane protein [Staphylococcus aureus]MCO4458499.1 hypothetical protein [Staphylococcus aureus]